MTRATAESSGLAVGHQMTSALLPCQETKRCDVEVLIFFLGGGFKEDEWCVNMIDCSAKMDSKYVC